MSSNADTAQAAGAGSNSDPSDNIYKMAPTGMTIILGVLIALSFCVIMVMCINCFLGTCHECKSSDHHSPASSERSIG